MPSDDVLPPFHRTLRRRPGRRTRYPKIDMQQVHEAAEYDRWFREQVQQALDEADSPNAEWLTTDEMKESMERWLTEHYGPKPENSR